MASTKDVAAVCQAPGCDRPTKEGRRYCWRDYKRVQRGEAPGGPPPERISPTERVLEAAQKWLESDAEDDSEYEANERALLSAARSLSRASLGASIRRGMATARSRGVHVGRPPKQLGDSALLQHMVAQLGLSATARSLRVDRKTLRRALVRGRKANFSPQAALGTLGRNVSLPPQVA